jgi:GNAT superfamily N-acetyltransferase
MYDQMEPGVAEVHRLFVTEEGRGNGVGRALLEEMFLQMRLDGYTAVRFSSARFLTHARQLYESLGFVDMPAPEDAPGHVYFMERSL